MSDFNNFIGKINQLQINMASFRKVMLHCHSPHSHDYYRTIACNPELLLKEEKEFKEKLDSSELDMIAVTDHMKFEYACRLSNLCTTKNCALPGVELNVRPPPPWNTFKIHVIAIFPEKYSHEEICKILPAGMPPEDQRNGIEEINNIDIRDLVITIHKYGGICFAAHVDSNNGIRRTFRQLEENGIALYAPDQVLPEEQKKEISDEFKDWILSAGFDGLEVAKTTDKIHYTWVSKIKGQKMVFPAILRSDIHHLDEIGKPENITHIKMTSPSYSDLVQALKFPETRIRFPNEVPLSPSPRILGIEITSTDDRGFFKEATVAFSDNLNCMIGPRGSGKSTIIEALRYALGLNKRLKEFEQAGAELAIKAMNLQKATLTNCIVHVAYLRKDGRTHILESVYDPKQECTTKFYDLDGKQIEIVDIDSNYPVRLFGWSEIEMLGREGKRQRELLDRLIPELAGLIASRGKMKQSLELKRGEIAVSVNKLLSYITRENGEIKKYREYKSDFEKLNTPEIDTLFKDIDNAKAKNIILSRLINNVQNWLAKISQCANVSLFDGLDKLLIEYPTINDWWVANKEHTNFVQRESEVKEALGKAQTVLNNLLKDIDVNINIIKQELMQKESTLKEQIGEEASKLVAADLRRIASERLQKVNQMRFEYNEEWKELQRLLDEWKQIVTKLSELHENISEKRLKRKEEIEEDLNRFKSSKMKISIRFEKSEDRREFIAHLYDCGLITKEVNARWKSNLWPEKIGMSCTPHELSNSLLSKTTLKLRESIIIEKKEYKIENNIADDLINAIKPFDIDKDSDLPVADKDLLNKVLFLAEVEWDDEEGILLNDKQIEDCSPGQRSSAMLPLISLVEESPLIIDQPEDNLDNSLIGKVLVDILAGLKEKRQIIVATHNPNIVVSGDAEQVIVMDALSDSKGICKEMGSIDKPYIVKSVVEIMEGGKDAFINRSKRYGREIENEAS
jgi:energy-coupling factor transporter ATP-binding protein EcfA2